jgi:hypothetical protein
MQTRILNFDNSVACQPGLTARAATLVVPCQDWAPHLRLGCRHSVFRRFQRDLADRLCADRDDAPVLNFSGSGDFHHVTLALLRRQPGPCNLLVIDNHPDWMRAVPLLHCGTWLKHAAALPQVRRVFHAGGEVDFDNSFRWLAPWPLLRSGKVVLLPAARRFERGSWSRVAHRPLRASPDRPVEPARVDELLVPYRRELSEIPLFVSIDKDVLRPGEAVANWDSGLLTAPELVAVLESFLRAAGNLAGMDVVGDWSPVRVRGLLRHYLHRTEHTHEPVEPEHAQRCNEAVNLSLLDVVVPFAAAYPRLFRPWAQPGGESLGTRAA